jgi:hypothetical protein
MMQVCEQMAVARIVSVKLDGELVSNVIYAAEDRGVVVVMQAGKPVMLTGKVEVGLAYKEQHVERNEPALLHAYKRAVNGYLTV